MKTICLVLFILGVAETEILIPTNNYNKIKNLINSILKENHCRLIVILKHKDADNTLYGEIVKYVNNLKLPQMHMKESSIGYFNGKYDQTFSYDAIADESRIYLAFLPNVTSAKDIVPKLQRIHFFRPRHRTILMIHNTFNQSTDLEEVQTVFKTYWTKEILNVVLIIRPEELYTYQPYLNEFVVKITGNNLFPDKLQDLNGYKLRMSIFVAALDAVLLKTGKVIGRDVSLWQTIANELNATYIHIRPTDNITYGLKFTNGSMTGVFRDVVKNVSEIAVNSRMVKLQFENLMESTYPHDREDVTIITPSADSIAEFVKFVMLFSMPLWLLVGSVAIGFAILWWLFVFPNEPIYAVLNSYTSTLGNPITGPTNGTARLLLIMYTSWIFFIQGAYHGTLTSVLTVPLFAPEINTLNQLEESSLNVYAAARFQEMFLANIGGTLTQKLVHRIKIVPDDPDIEKLVRQRGHYALVQKETFALLSVLQRDNYKSDGSNIYRLMTEKPMPTQVCYATRYGSPFIPKIDGLLRKFQEAGLDKHWKTITVHRIMLDEKHGEIPAAVTLRVLTFDNISIAFVSLAFGIAFAFLVLLIENLINHCKSL